MIYHEQLHQGGKRTAGQFIEYGEVLFDEDNIRVLDDTPVGRVLLIDDVVQLTTQDEHIYHEMLVHVPVHQRYPKRVLVIGGGDGGVLRELCKHSFIEEIVLVDISDAVIEVSRNYLPSVSAGAFDDPRVQVIIGDGNKFVQDTENENRFDLIISDCPDPIGEAAILFSQQFYRGCYNCLTSAGVLVTQAGSLAFQLDTLKVSYRLMQDVGLRGSLFRIACPMYYGGDLAALYMFKGRPEYGFGHTDIKTRYYTPAIHQAALALPRDLIEQMAGLKE